MQARFYDPQVGRMLSTDPQNFDGASPFTFNRYAYGNNNPYRYTDPNGEIALQVVAGLVGGAVGFTTNVVAQAATKGGMGNVNFYEATAAGAATAAVSVAVTLSPALVANPSALSALSGAVNATASAAADLAQGKSVNGTQAAASAVGGMLGAPTGAAVARALGNEVVGEIGGAIAGEAAAAGLTIGVPAVTDAAAAGLSNAADSVNKGLKSAGEGLRETFEPRKTPD